MSEIILKHDLTIPVGTIFKTLAYNDMEGYYSEKIIGKDDVMVLLISEDILINSPELFEKV